MLERALIQQGLHLLPLSKAECSPNGLHPPSPAPGFADADVRRNEHERVCSLQVSVVVAGEAP